MVNSKDPELAVPFNSATSYNSLTGGQVASASTSQSLQVRTVDEAGFLEMPIIGKVQCNGLTRHELAEAIAGKIREGGYINDPTVNVQFDDMKISARWPAPDSTTSRATRFRSSTPLPWPAT